MKDESLPELTEQQDAAESVMNVLSAYMETKNLRYLLMVDVCDGLNTNTVLTYSNISTTRELCDYTHALESYGETKKGTFEGDSKEEEEEEWEEDGDED